MFQSINMPSTDGMDFGMGVNLLNGQIAGKGVDAGEITRIEKANGQEVSFNLVQINSLEELYSSIGISVEASGHYGLFSAEGKFGYSNEVKFNSQSTFLLARCTVQNAFIQCADAKIKPDAAKLIEQGKIDPFQKRFGDGFVRGMQTGGEFHVVIAITSIDREEQTSIAASLRGKYGGLFAAIEVDTKLDSNTKSKIAKAELRVSAFQKGGQGDDLSPTNDIEAVMARLKAFPKIILEHPVPYDVQVASYDTLALPEGPSPTDIQAQKESLADYARIQLKLQSLRNDVEFIQLHPDFYINPPDIATLNQWQVSFTDQINQLKRQASKCANNPVGGCDTVPLQLPPGFTTPQRTPGISGVWQHVTDGVGDATWTFTPRGDNQYDAQEQGLGFAKGIALLKGNHLQLDFAAGGTTGRYQWDLNPEFTSGVGTLEFFTVHVETGIHNSRLIRIK